MPTSGKKKKGEKKEKPPDLFAHGGEHVGRKIWRAHVEDQLAVARAQAQERRAVRGQVAVGLVVGHVEGLHRRRRLACRSVLRPGKRGDGSACARPLSFSFSFFLEMMDCNTDWNTSKLKQTKKKKK